MPVEPTLDVEHILFETGAAAVIGCDEVGRGAIAGPVCVGMGMISPPVDDFPAGVRDSKLLSPKRRAALVDPIESWLASSGVGESSASEIDAYGIVHCLGAAGASAYAQLAVSNPAATVIILDGAFDWLTPGLMAAGIAQLPVVRTRAKADRDCAVVAAASVLAKEFRDAKMIAWAQEYSAYGWDHNKGYGSAAHLNAITEFGPSKLHRMKWLHPHASSKSAAGR